MSRSTSPVAPDDPAQERIARLEQELAAAQRTVEVLVSRIERQVEDEAPDRRAFLRAIGQLETTVAARRRDLAAREEYYRALFHQSPDAILALDAEGVVLSCNRTAELTFGLDLSDMVGRPVTDLLDPESGAALTSLLWSGFVGVGDAELTVPPDRRLGFSVARLAPGEVLLVLRDVTQRRRLEDELERARRHAGYGRLAAELAVEITNPLSVVLGRLELLQQRPPKDPARLAPVLTLLAEHCRRIDATVGNLRALGQPRAPRPRAVGVGDLVARAVARASLELRRVVVDAELPEGITVRVDPEHGELALRNLMLFLADVMPRDRTLALRVAVTPNGRVRLHLRGDQARLPDEVLSALGNQGTGPVDAGIGLGLSIAWVLITDGGGRIFLHWDGANHEVVVELPGSAPRPHADSTAPSVLVVDDDQLLCETVSWMLSGQGMVVRTTRTAEDALRLMTTSTFDCVLADLILPGMDGVQFLGEIARRWPAMADRLVLTTGSDEDPPTGVRMLRKPFDRARLLEALELRR